MPRSTADQLSPRLSFLTRRDRDLLEKLDDHKVLTTSQIHQIWFNARRTCQLRLNRLLELELVQHFRFARDDGGLQQYHWTLGVLGQQWRASTRGRPEPTARTAIGNIHQLQASPSLGHLILVNDFFARLAGHERDHPCTRLQRWWPEAKTTNAFGHAQPDGHALWTVDGATGGLFLEADTGSEALTRVVSKLAGYRNLADNDGPQYPVLFWLHSPKREDNLHQLLRNADLRVPVATAVHHADPAGPVWLIPGHATRVHFWEMPSHHGRPVAGNPNFRDGELDLPGRDPFHY